MDTLSLLTLASAAASGVLLGSAGWYWYLRRVMAGLHQRLERSEKARSGAIERSAQAREQIAQLNRAITELRRAHSTVRPPPPSQREQVEAALLEGDEKTLILPRRSVASAFQDTEMLTTR